MHQGREQLDFGRKALSLISLAGGGRAAQRAQVELVHPVGGLAQYGGPLPRLVNDEGRVHQG